MKTLIIQFTNDAGRTDLSIVTKEGSIDVKDVRLRLVARKSTARLEIVMPELLAPGGEQTSFELAQALKQLTSTEVKHG